MNREIRFRGWHKELKKMLYPHGGFDSMHQCRDSDGNHIMMEDGRHLMDLMTWDGLVYHNGKYQDIEWMQYTGIKDINGKEIFDGDIARGEAGTGVGGKTTKYKQLIYKVFWNDWMHGWDIHAENYGKYRFQPALDEIEIIGNIFENPELLK
jgi:uncharacterized phage protein (TIGR01671 family)